MSVIVPVLNDAEALARLLGQLQDEASLETIVVDGGSTDGSRDVGANADVLLEAAAGRANQLRAGIARAQGTVVWMVHADTGIDRMNVDTVRSLARSNEFSWGRFDVRLASTRLPFRLIEWSMNRRSRLTGICTGDQGIFVRKALLELIDGVPPLALMEDIELSKRLRRLARPVCLPGPIQTSARRWLRDGIVRTVLRMWGFRLRYFFGADPASLARRYYNKPDG